ncbi:uncharacterized protein BX663DRAFT_552418 [Cokeromyces recurvatus]|uniref:uncharacterized protein n=1 Tax=Cokeromyces recurvatus TaxID=90255 RepID=UPI00221FB8BA|nr:uncharacterized protein BX663DRAFT_552418 [Cokeromyces recurvatus]KAI7902506.1 hypothetical protein BX663DRAFT_552418 [Cokeromyces recurvatus]
MPLNSPPNSSLTKQRLIMERCSTLKKTCEQCKRRRRVCNSQRPCSNCIETQHDCVYNVIPDHSRSVFSTQAARRLSSGSACETCRRRKTKCDGGSPCTFCATNNIECVNHSERRHLSKLNTNNKANHPPSTETMDRIEDRLRRIERLMTAFTPSPMSSISSTTTTTNKESHKIRPHRHSVQGINISKEKMTELNNKRAYPYSSPTRIGSPPTSMIANSMLNLSISNTNSFIYKEQQQLPSPPNSAHSIDEWKTTAGGTIPSLMDQLSKRTFATSAIDYTTTQYPIYPLTPPPSIHSQSRQISSPPPLRPHSHS